MRDRGLVESADSDVTGAEDIVSCLKRIYYDDYTSGWLMRTKPDRSSLFFAMLILCRDNPIIVIIVRGQGIASMNVSHD